MTLPKIYRKHFRQRMVEAFPVWDIGTDVACGDTGTFDNGHFERTGSLKGRVDDALLKTQRNTIPGQEVFSSHAQIDIGADADAAPAPGTSLNGKISFTKKDGVYFEANDLVQIRLAELGALREKLKQDNILDPHEVFISSVWHFASCTLLVAGNDGWTLDVSGTAPALPARLAGGSVTLSSTSGSGIMRKINGDRPEHPMGIRIQGRRGWFNDRITTLSEAAGQDMTDFVDVTGAHDDT